MSNNTNVPANPGAEAEQPQLPDCSAGEAECDNTYFTRIRLGWMWKGAPAINGGKYVLQAVEADGQLFDSSTAPKTLSGSFSGNIIELDVPFRKRCMLFVNAGSAGIHWIHLYPEFDLEALPAVGDKDGQVKMMKARLRNLGIQCGDVDASFTDRTAWALRWFQKRRMNYTDRYANGKPEEVTLALINTEHEDVVIKAPQSLHAEVSSSGPHSSFWLFETDIHRNSPYPDGFGVLYRKWSQENNVRNIDPDALDHDPVTGKTLPVWTGVQQTQMFPFHTDQPNDAAFVFAAPKSAKNKYKENKFFNTINLSQPVNWLQDHLRELGFLAGPKPVLHDSPESVSFSDLQDAPGYYGRYTEWSVRFFQYYAKMDNVAQDACQYDRNIAWDDTYMNRLRQVAIAVDGKYPADKPVSGAVNLSVQEAMRFWLDNCYRCPVVIFERIRDRHYQNNRWMGHDPIVVQHYQSLQNQNAPQIQTLQNRITQRKANPTANSRQDKIDIANWEQQIKRLRYPERMLAAYTSRRSDEVLDNLWRHDDYKSTAPRVFAVDFTGRFASTRMPNVAQYPLNVPRVRHYNEEAGWICIGEHADYGRFNGPQSTPTHVWGPQTEFLPDKLYNGRAWNVLTQRERSIYKILRSVSYVECYAHADSINCYDGAVMSFGPCHWTIGVGTAKGELPAFFAYLADTYSQSAQYLLGSLGISTEDTWTRLTSPHGVRAGVNVGALNPKVETYTRLQREDGSSYHQLDVAEEKDIFRSWHMFYHFMMYLRTDDNISCAMWDMAEFRLERILNIDIDSIKIDTAMQSGLVTQSFAKLGRIFTSEKSIAMLLRWHVNRPGDIAILNTGLVLQDRVPANSPVPNPRRVSGYVSANLLKRILTNAGINAQIVQNTWVTTQNNELSLLTSIIQESSTPNNRRLGEIRKTIPRIDRWGTANEDRNFTLNLGSDHKLDIVPNPLI